MFNDNFCVYLMLDQEIGPNSLQRDKKFLF